ncbi:MAG: VWA domain-containing protein [Planctomycetaceae bacterium]|nr:VWA domain-containing protein [Planctomycetaceae bacterium]
MFNSPLYFIALWLVPLFAVLYWYAFKRQQRTLAGLFEKQMAERLVPKISTGRTVFAAGLTLLSLTLGIIALAGPLFGVYDEKVSQTGTDVFILLDVSRSMLAEDVAPNRLARAKSDIQDLLGRVAGDRIGLIVFAGKPIVKVPLTTDQGFFLEVLREINTNSAPRGGTAIGDAVRKALSVMPPDAARQQSLVLITDGDDQESMPLEAAKEAAGCNVRILTVGLGDTKEGSRIPLRDENGTLTYLKHNGQEVWSKVNEAELETIAKITGGAFVSAGTKSFDLGAIYADSIGKLQGTAAGTEQRQKSQQQYQIFLFVSILCLLGVLTLQL